MIAEKRKLFFSCTLQHCLHPQVPPYYEPAHH